MESEFFDETLRGLARIDEMFRDFRPELVADVRESSNR